MLYLTIISLPASQACVLGTSVWSGGGGQEHERAREKNGGRLNQGSRGRASSTRPRPVCDVYQLMRDTIWMIRALVAPVSPVTS